MAEDKNERDRGLHRHGEPDPKKWDEQVAVAGREPDVAPDNSTFGDRAKAKQPAKKQVAAAEDKSVKPAARKKG